MSFQWLRRYFKAVMMIYNDDFLMSVFKCRGDKTAVGRWSFTPFTFLYEGVIERHFSTSVPTVSSMPAWLLDSCTITAIKAVQYRKPETDALNRLRTSRFGQTQFALPSASSPRGTTPEDGGRKYAQGPETWKGSREQPERVKARPREGNKVVYIIFTWEGIIYQTDGS